MARRPDRRVGVESGELSPLTSSKQDLQLRDHLRATSVPGTRKGTKQLGGARQTVVGEARRQKKGPLDESGRVVTARRLKEAGLETGRIQAGGGAASANKGVLHGVLRTCGQNPGSSLMVTGRVASTNERRWPGQAGTRLPEHQTEDQGIRPRRENRRDAENFLATGPQSTRTAQLLWIVGRTAGRVRRPIGLRQLEK